MIVRSKITDFDCKFNTSGISYLNFPFIRTVSLIISYKIKLKKILKVHNFDIIFSYNLYPWHYKAYSLLSNTKIKNINIPIILDEDDPKENRWRVFKKKVKYADGLIFLSYWGFENFPMKIPRFHLDSGSNKWNGSIKKNNSKKPVIVYAGKYQEKYGGLPKLANILNSISIDCKIYLCGKADESLINKYFSENPKVSYLGFLSEEDLHKILLKADLFINYRPPEISDNIMIFPSKINHYLSYGKPVISSYTAGLHPCYRNYLFFPEQEDVIFYKDLIEEVLNWDEKRIQTLYYKIKEWFVHNKTWDLMNEKMLNWIEKEFHSD